MYHAMLRMDVVSPIIEVKPSTHRDLCDVQSQWGTSAFPELLAISVSNLHLCVSTIYFVGVHLQSIHATNASLAPSSLCLKSIVSLIGKLHERMFMLYLFADSRRLQPQLEVTFFTPPQLLSLT